MRVSVLVGIATVAVGAVALFAAVQFGGESPEQAAATSTPEPAAVSAKPRTWAHDAEAEELVESLLASDSPADRRKMIQLYAKWGGDDTKVHARRAVIDALLERRFASPKGALREILAAIDADRELAGGDDETIEYAADQLQVLWTVPGMFEHGRDKLLSARTDKSRALLADSLSDFAAKGREFVDPNEQRTAWLGSDLADAHAVTKSQWAKDRIRAGMQVTMGDDVAKVLEAPLAVQPSDLHTLQDELNGVREAVAGIDEDSENFKALGGLAEADDDALVEAVGAAQPSPDGA